MADKCCSSIEIQKNDSDENKSCSNDNLITLENVVEVKTSCCSSKSIASEKPNVVKSSCCSSESLALEKPNEVKSSCCSSDSIVLEKPSGPKSSCCSSKVEEQSIDIPISPATSEEKVIFRVHGMDCPACAVTIEKGLSTLKGIRDVTVNYSTAKLQVVGDIGSFDQIENQVKKLGYTVESLERDKNMRTYTIEGMDCGSCAKSIENHLNPLPSVKKVSVNFSTGKMKIDHDNSVEDIISEVAKIGYKASLLTKSSKAPEAPKNYEGNGLIIFSGVLIALGFIGSYNGISTLMSNILYAIVIVLTGYKPVKSAYYALKSRSLDMNVLMSAAAIGAALIGEWLEGATVVWLFALGIVLQNRSIEKTRNSIRNLMNLAPPEAWVLIGTELVKKPVEEISIGQIIIVKPGDKIPLDGEIVKGVSSVNQAPITGESIPVDKAIGDTVYAGTINESGSLEIKVTKLVEDTTISKIIHLVEEAQEQKAPTQAFVDKFASIYTPIVFVLAIAIMVIPPLLGLGPWGEWFYKALELLVIACPCALVISTPVTIVSAIGNAAKNGVLIKGGSFLEIAGSINAIAFDKTGTLTKGKPTVSEIKALGTSEDELLSLALTLEDYSTHPIAKTIVNYAKEKGIQSKNGQLFKSIVGKGVQATIDGVIHYAGNLKLFEEMNVSLGNIKTLAEEFQRKGKTVVIIGSEQKLLGIIAVSDTLRKTTVNALNALKQVGINQTIMLTGDNEGTAKVIASEAPIDRYFAELMPEDKVNSIKQLQKEGYKVAMVGDGINDAPALATSDLGIAMGGAGTDTAMETADIVLMADNLEKLPHTINLSRKALKIIKQNIWFSLIVKFIALALIFPGWLTLWIAVLSDTGAAIIVILNALRLLKVKG